MYSSSRRLRLLMRFVDALSQYAFPAHYTPSVSELPHAAPKKAPCARFPLPPTLGILPRYGGGARRFVAPTRVHMPQLFLLTWQAALGQERI
jgi:hypothetical protein